MHIYVFEFNYVYFLKQYFDETDVIIFEKNFINNFILYVS